MFLKSHRLFRARVLLPAAGVLAAGLTLANATSASAAQSPVNLGTATSFAVLAGSTVTNTGPSVVSGDLGVSPGSAITGFRPPPTEPGLVINGSIHAADAVADLAQTDESTAYNDAAGRSPVTQVPVELGGSTLVGGVYASATLGLTGTLTLSGDASSVWVFQAASTLITSTASRVVLTGGATACNVFWQIGSSATLGTGSSFTGTVLAHTSITADTGATVQGRLFAQTAAVTLDSNTITRPDCTTPTTPTGSSSSAGAPSSTGGSSTPGTSSPSGSSPASDGPSSAPGAGSGPGAPGASNPAHHAPGSGHASASVTRSPGHRTTTSTHRRAVSTSPVSTVSTTGVGRTTTTLSSTGENIATPTVIGLLGLFSGGALLVAARRRTVSARHRR